MILQKILYWKNGLDDFSSFWFFLAHSWSVLQIKKQTNGFKTKENTYVKGITEINTAAWCIVHSTIVNCNGTRWWTHIFILIIEFTENAKC